MPATRARVLLYRTCMQRGEWRVAYPISPSCRSTPSLGMSTPERIAELAITIVNRPVRRVQRGPWRVKTKMGILILHLSLSHITSSNERHRTRHVPRVQRHNTRLNLISVPRRDVYSYIFSAHLPSRGGHFEDLNEEVLKSQMFKNVRAHLLSSWPPERAAGPSPRALEVLPRVSLVRLSSMCSCFRSLSPER
jgi:hypothetical protein